MLAADSPGHVLITGKLGCEAEELARIVHKISKRRRQLLIEINRVPDDHKSQVALVHERLTKIHASWLPYRQGRRCRPA